MSKQCNHIQKGAHNFTQAWAHTDRLHTFSLFESFLIWSSTKQSGMHVILTNHIVFQDKNRML